MVFGLFHAVVLRFGFAQGRLKKLQFPIALQYIVQRGYVQRGRFLGDRGKPPMRRHRYFPAVLRDFALYQGKQAGLAGTVSADKPDAPLRINGQTGFIEQQLAAALQGQVFEFYHFGKGRLCERPYFTRICKGRLKAGFRRPFIALPTVAQAISSHKT